MNKDDRGFIRRQPDQAVDPAVAATIRSGQQQQVNRQLTKRERDKKAKQAAKNAAAKPRRVDWLIDPDLKTWVADQSQDIGCTGSQVVEFALNYLKGAIEAGQIDLEEYTKPFQNTRYSKRLIYPTGSEKG